MNFLKAVKPEILWRYVQYSLITKTADALGLSKAEGQRSTPLFYPSFEKLNFPRATCTFRERANNNSKQWPMFGTKLSKQHMLVVPELSRGPKPAWVT